MHGVTQRKFGNALLASIAALVACGMTGCAAPQDPHQANQQQCLGYGFQPSTNDFAQCMQRENIAERYYWGSGPRWGPPYTYPWW